MEAETIAVIGAGPAGIAAAIQLKRYGLVPLLLEKSRAGGLLVNANLVENYPGFPRGISGLELVRLFEEQLKIAGVEITKEEVIELEYRGHFTIRASRGTYRSRIAVIASGTRPNEPDLPNEAPDRAFTEVSPIADITGKKVVIVGAGDAAFDYALNLARRNDVTILNRSNRVKCLPLLWQRAQESPRIAYRQDSPLTGIRKSPDGILVFHESSAGAWEMRADYIIFAIGRAAEIGYASPRLARRIPELQRRGLIYLVGDVKNEIYRQASIAVGDGVHAAMKIQEKLKETERCGW
jgi:thioredoxin reductase